MNISTHPAPCHQQGIDLALLPKPLLAQDNTMNTGLIKHENPQSIIQGIINDRMSMLKSGNIYTAENLCGPELWSALTPSDRKSIGYIIADLVKTQKLPLIRTPNSSSNKAQYQSC